MEFWSKGLGKKTIVMRLSGGESQVSEDALCLKGIMDAPVSWEYVMLLEAEDLNDFFAILQEPSLAKYVHSSPNRWQLYAGLVMGGVQIALLAVTAAFKRLFGMEAEQEKVVIELPPPSVIKKKKKVLYKRRLSTTNLAAPVMSPEAAASASAGVFWPAEQA